MKVLEMVIRFDGLDSLPDVTSLIRAINMSSSNGAIYDNDENLIGYFRQCEVSEEEFGI